MNFSESGSIGASRVPLQALHVAKHSGQMQRLPSPFSSCTIYVPQLWQEQRMLIASFDSLSVFYHVFCQKSTPTICLHLLAKSRTHS